VGSCSLSLKTCSKDDPHNFVGSSQTCQNFFKPVFTKLFHTIGLCGLLNITQRCASNNHVRNFCIHDHQFVEASTTPKTSLSVFFMRNTSVKHNLCFRIRHIK